MHLKLSICTCKCLHWLLGVFYGSRKSLDLCIQYNMDIAWKVLSMLLLSENSQPFHNFLGKLLYFPSSCPPFDNWSWNLNTLAGTLFYEDHCSNISKLFSTIIIAEREYKDNKLPLSWGKMGLGASLLPLAVSSPPFPLSCVLIAVHCLNSYFPR